ncbi:Egl nine 1 [Elasticomyces elasticus]|nr:Egl nine 1 [Elasticomyces elasticus]
MALREHNLPVAQICIICGAGGPLLSCCRCKHVRYCGKACQADHWPLHKIECKLLVAQKTNSPATRPGKPPMTVFSPNFRAYAVPVQAVALEMALITSTQLKNYKLAPESIDIDAAPLLKFVELPTTGPRVPNLYSSYFSMDPDPKSPTFGQPLISPPTDQALLMVRQDGRYLKMAQLVAMMFMVENVLGEVAGVKEREDAGEVVDREEMAARLLTPASFVRVFELLRWIDASSGGDKFEGVECPAQVVDQFDLD